MDYFAKFKKRIAPPKVQPTSAMQLAKFHKCWEYVHVSIYISESSCYFFGLTSNIIEYICNG